MNQRTQKGDEVASGTYAYVPRSIHASLPPNNLRPESERGASGRLATLSFIALSQAEQSRRRCSAVM